MLGGTKYGAFNAGHDGAIKSTFIDHDDMTRTNLKAS